MARRREQASPDAIARWTFEREMFGPSIDANTSPSDGRVEQTPALSPRHIRFRCALTTLGIAHRSARASARMRLDRFSLSAAHALDGTSRRGFHELERTRRRVKLAIEQPAPNTRASLSALYQELAPVWLLLELISSVRRIQFPPMADLPWTDAWLLDLARLSSAGSSNPGRWLPPQSALVHTKPVHTVSIELTGYGPGPIEVVSSRSRTVLKARLNLATERAVAAGWVTQQGRSAESVTDDDLEDRAFRAHLRDQDADLRLASRVNDVLDATFSRPGRVYTLDPATQTRRDVALWVRVRMDGAAPKIIAGDADERFERDDTFRFRRNGLRSQEPLTPQGVKLAVDRADSLLRAPLRQS